VPSAAAIARAEDRELFKTTMIEYGWMCRRSGFAHTPEGRSD